MKTPNFTHTVQQNNDTINESMTNFIVNASKTKFIVFHDKWE